MGCLAVFSPAAVGQDATNPKPTPPPKWDKFPEDVFFRDAFREALVGSRPARLGESPGQAQHGSERRSHSPGEAADWDTYVTARTLEDEIKTLQIAVQKTVTTPSRFRAGDHQAVRRMFTELAALFAVISRFGGDVRWKEDALVARDLFARAAANAKVSSLAAFNEAKQRKLDLEELVRGGSLAVSSKVAQEENDWQAICDRAPLMQRFTQGFDDGIVVWTSTDKSFQTNLNSIRREAELLRLFSVILTREGMEDASDEDYVSYCRELQRAAEQLLQSIRASSRQDARKATSDIQKSCDQCHDDYRA